MFALIARKFKAVTQFSIGQRIWAKFAHENKNNTLEEYYEACSHLSGYDLIQCRIDMLLRLSPAEYDDFVTNFLKDDPRIAGKGGTESDSIFTPDAYNNFSSANESEDWFAKSFRSIVLVSAPDRSPIVIDPQGYNYSRYVGVYLQTEPPVIYNTDNPLGRVLRHDGHAAIIIGVSSIGDGLDRFEVASFDKKGMLNSTEILSKDIDTHNWQWAYKIKDYNKFTEEEIANIRAVLDEQLERPTGI